LSLCQYCDKARTHIGYFDDAPVSLCEEHRRSVGGDFDRVERVKDLEPPASDTNPMHAFGHGKGD
jgi:hypothetical protein